MVGFASVLAYVLFVHISSIFASPQGEGFPPSPKGILKSRSRNEFGMTGRAAHYGHAEPGSLSHGPFKNGSWSLKIIFAIMLGHLEKGR